MINLGFLVLLSAVSALFAFILGFRFGQNAHDDNVPYNDGYYEGYKSARDKYRGDAERFRFIRDRYVSSHHARSAMPLYAIRSPILGPESGFTAALDEAMRRAE